MYINKKSHILSAALFETGCIRAVGEVANSAARMTVNKTQGPSPDMLNTTIENFANMVSIIQIVAVTAVFYLAFNKLIKIRNVVPKEDYSEMAKLQEELGGDVISSLSSYSIMQLLQLWAAILVGIQIVYDATNRAYQDFVQQICFFIDFSDADIASAFVSVYNNTHGFKYIGMFVAICLGIFVTGVFLKDAPLKISAFAIMCLFMLAFAILQMNTVKFMDRHIGIVWTSVLFHMIQTVGLFGVAIYLSKKYKGL